MSIFFETSIEKLEKFFKILKKDSSDDVFLVLKEILDFNSAYIFFINPHNIRLNCSYNSRIEKSEYEITTQLKDLLFSDDAPEEEIFADLLGIKKSHSLIFERLRIQNNTYGFILLEKTSQKSYSNEERKVFKTCAAIISNLIKDIELTKIMKMQTEALQEGILETNNAYKIIKSQNKKIIAADKIKNKFLSNVSHELRTPLNSIIGFSELLQNPALGCLNEKQADYIKDIQISGIHLLGMINEILDISKLEAQSTKLTLKEFDITLNIDEVLNILRPLYEKKSLKIIKSVESFNIVADYQKIQQVLFNLINNAIKFTPKNGTITIETKKERKYCTIKIKDNGCGIALENHKKIFKKFEQLDQSENSTGLGLTITKELVKMHSGTIKIDSEFGKGAEFIVKIPLKGCHKV